MCDLYRTITKNIYAKRSTKKRKAKEAFDNKEKEKIVAIEN